MLATAGIALPAAASASTKTVYAGPPPSAQKIAVKLVGKSFAGKYNPDVDDFFLHRVTIHAGDTVSFLNPGFHTIDLPGSTGKDLSLFVPGAPVSGAKDSAGNPFWFNGHVPSLGLNPSLLAGSGPAAYDGSTRIDSGLPLGPPKPLKVRFTKAGTYKYFCDVHPGMVGFVVVKPKGQPVPSAKQDAAALKAQITSDVLGAKKAVTKTIPAAHVSLGLSAAHGVELFAMFPSSLTVARNSVVTFSMPAHSREVHTASFGPKGYLTNLSNSVVGPSPAQAVFYPSDPGPLVLTPTAHGNGYVSSGVLDADPATPSASSATVKFTTAGTYHYICLIHPFMRGTITVR